MTLDSVKFNVHYPEIVLGKTSGKKEKVQIKPLKSKTYFGLIPEFKKITVSLANTVAEDQTLASLPTFLLHSSLQSRCMTIQTQDRLSPKQKVI